MDLIKTLTAQYMKPELPADARHGAGYPECGQVHIYQ